MIEAWFDGCCEPTNPGGYAAFGIVIEADGVRLLEVGKYIGHGKGISNNVAEYSGAICVLEIILLNHGKNTIDIKIYGDSKLVVNQMNGNWKARGGLYVPYLERARKLQSKLKGNIQFIWIPREKNEECDKLSKQVLRNMGVTFRIQPEAA